MKNCLLRLVPCILGLWGFVDLGRGSEALIAEDAHLSAARPTKKHGATPVLIVGRNERTLLRFDLSALPSGLTGDQVAKATLQLWEVSATRSGPVKIFPVETAWTEGTVTNATAPVIGTTEVGSFTVTAGQKKAFVSADVTALVREWIEGTRDNFGMALVPLAAGAVATFDSKESTATSHEPRLEIVLAGPEGMTGQQGPKGDKGDKGDTGQQGNQGLVGDKGDKGDQGPMGLKGDKGDPGTPAVIPAGALIGVSFTDAPPSGYTALDVTSAAVEKGFPEVPLTMDYLTYVAIAGDYFFGICVDFGGVDYLLQFHIPSRTWTIPATTPNINRDTAIVGGADGKLYLFSGSSARTYNPSTAAWGNLPNMPITLTGYGSMAATLTGKFYVIGSTVQEYNPGTNSWMVLNPPPAGFEWSRAGGVAPIGAQIYAYDKHNITPRILSFNPSAKLWEFVQNDQSFSMGSGDKVFINGVRGQGGTLAGIGTDLWSAAHARLDTLSNVIHDESPNYVFQLSVAYGNGFFGFTDNRTVGYLPLDKIRRFYLKN